MTHGHIWDNAGEGSWRCDCGAVINRQAMTPDELAAAIRAEVFQVRALASMELLTGREQERVRPFTEEPHLLRVLARCNDDLARVERNMAELAAARYRDGEQSDSLLARHALVSLRGLARVLGVQP